MNQNWIFIPVLLQIFLTLCLYVALNVAKVKAVKRNEVNNDRRALHDDAWPDSVLQINNCIRNQFEVPVLFFVLSIILWCLQAVDAAVLTVAAAFVLSRYAHASIHAGSNHVPSRRRVFTIGVVLVIVLLVFTAYAIVVR